MPGDSAFPVGMVSKQAQFHGSLCSRPPDHPARVVTNPETGRRLLIHEQRILTGEAIMASTATSRHVAPWTMAQTGEVAFRQPAALCTCPEHWYRS